MTKPTEVVRIEVAAAVLKVTPRTIYRLIESGALDAVDTSRPGSKKSSLRILASSLKAYEAEQGQFVDVE